MDRTIRKALFAEIEKSDDVRRPVRVRISTVTADRDGDVVVPSGGDLKSFLKNPVVLWAHDRHSLPIARATKLETDANGMSAEVVFGSHPAAKEVEQAVRDGIVSAASIGFRAKKWTANPGTEAGLIFNEWELLEFSFVPVPANPEAIVEAKAIRDSLRAEVAGQPVSKEQSTPAAGSRESPHGAANPEEKKQMSENQKPAENVTEQKPVATVSADEFKAFVGTMTSTLNELKAALKTTVSDPAAKIVEQAKESAPAVVKPAAKQIHEEQPEKGAHLGRIAIAAARAKLTPGLSVKEALSDMGRRDTADAIEREEHRRKALGIGTMAAGGVVVPEVQSGEMIELLRAKSVVMAAGPRVVQMTSDSMVIPRQTAAASAGYVGEAAAIAASNASFDQVKLTAKKLAAFTVASNEFIRDASISAEQFIRDDLLMAAGLKMDLAAMTGAGTAYEPRGLASWIVSAHQTQQTGTSFDNWNTDLNKLFNALESDNVDTTGCVYFMNPQTKLGLWKLANTNGIHEFREEMQASGTLWGKRYFLTTQISTSGAANRVYFVNMTDFIVGMRSEFEIAVGESYDESGTTKSAFAQDQIAIRLVGRHDFALRHPESGAIIHTVTLA